MNAPEPIAPVRGLHVAGGGQRRRDPAAGERFRRALGDRAAGGDDGAGDPGGEAAGATPALARGLQPRRPAGRREQGGQGLHVDVLA